MEGIEATYVDVDIFKIQGNLTDVLPVGKKIKADCGIDGFKFGVVTTSVFDGNETTIDLTPASDDLTSNLIEVWYETSPHMDDGRPIVRADTRPVNTETYFTMSGDSTAIGDGVHLQWDFSNNDDIYSGPEVPPGMKAKQLLMTFNCPVYLKDGTIYFFDAPWDAYIDMDVVVPTGAYYPNPEGPIPASALGLPGSDMYAQATENTQYQKYVNKHHLFGSCPMGDELNAEGAAIRPVPVGWFIRGLIVTPTSDNVSKGYGSLEMYRCHTTLLPGQTLDNIH